MLDFSFKWACRRPAAGLLAALGLLATAGATRAQSVSFAPVANYTTGGDNATGLALADVNGDGKTDVLTANFNSNTVAVLLGSGTGGFGTATTFGSGGAQPVGVAVADLNGDGKLDLAVANQGSNTVGVLLGTGPGSFGTATTYGCGGVKPTDLLVADVNADGRLDVLTTNQNSGTVGVLPGTGTGSFGTATVLNATLTSVVGLALADLNGDGRRDLVVGTYTNGTSVVVFLATSTGGFGPAATYFVGADSKPGRLTIADVNGDGKPDVLTANNGNNSAGILLGTGTGSFGAATTYSTGVGGAPQDLVAADVDNDGRLDLLVTNSGSATAAVLLGTGPGTFGPATTYGTGNTFPYNIRVADVNGDSRPDLLLTNYLGSRLSVLLNTTALGSLSPARELGAQVLVHPNPAHGLVRVALPGVAGASTVQAELLSALGQVVHRQQAALPPGGTTLTLPAEGLATGLYVLRLTAGTSTVTKRVLLE